MKIPPPHTSRSSVAFTLLEVMFAVAFIGLAVFSLYIALSSGFRVVEASRENLRATQIVVEKLETVRLYTMSQLTATNFLPEYFTNKYNFKDDSGFDYVGTIKVEDVDPTDFDDTNYRTNLKVVTIEVKWTSFGIDRSRKMQSLVARDGLQDYVY